MKCLVLAASFILALGGPAAAQPAMCPALNIAGPTGVTIPGDNMVFTVNVDTKDREKLSYHWWISAGAMVKGQGTPTITVKHDCRNANVTATVEIKGLPEGCPYSASETAGVSEGCGGQPQLIDEYERMSFGNEKLHLDNVVVQLRNTDTQRVVFAIYPQRKNEINAIRKRVAAIARYLKNRGVSKKRFDFIFGPGGEYRTKIWLVPIDGALPVLD